MQNPNAVNANDRVIFLWNYDAAVAANNPQLAQTSLISISNLLNFPTQTDPANSTSLTITQGSLFFSNTFGYYAVANNVTKRFALSSF